MLFSLHFNWSWIFNFWIDSGLWIISYPLTHKYFISLREKVGTLPFSHIIHPMAFKMIPTTFGKHTIPTSLSHKPHPFINITIWVNHSAFSVRLTIHPHAIVTISWFKKHRSSSFFLIIFPIACILSSQFIFRVTYPKCALAMPFVIAPPSFIFITILIVLNTKSVFFIIFPITYIFMWSYPFMRFLWSVFIKRLSLH